MLGKGEAYTISHASTDRAAQSYEKKSIHRRGIEGFETERKSIWAGIWGMEAGAVMRAESRLATVIPESAQDLSGT